MVNILSRLSFKTTVNFGSRDGGVDEEDCFVRFDDTTSSLPVSASASGFVILVDVITDRVVRRFGVDDSVGIKAASNFN